MIDLHAHTTISDGTVTPAELIRLAKRQGLKAIAITDHDSIDGHAEAEAEAIKLGINLVKGIEFSVAYGENRIIHILGLGIDTTNQIFMNIYTKYRVRRAAKLGHVFDSLKSMGVKLTPEDVEPYIIGDYIDRQAIARAMVKKGITESIRNSWIDYIDHIDYKDGELITPTEAFEAIHAAGGKAFMAHYHLNIGLKGYSEDERLAKLGELKELGLDGLELYYPSFTSEDIELCREYINRFNFIYSGGTDYHGKNRPHIELGIGEGDFRVPDELLDFYYSCSLVGE